MANDRNSWTGPLFGTLSRESIVATGSEYIPLERIKAADAAAKAAGTQWLRDAEAYILAFAAGREFFMAEEVKARWDEAGLPAPPDGRAWGSAFASLSRKKRILKVGYALDAFGSPKPKWTAGA